MAYTMAVAQGTMADETTFRAARRDNKVNSKNREDIRRRLWAYQGGVCVQCGDSLPSWDASVCEFSHLIPATYFDRPGSDSKPTASKAAGWIWGNLAMTCTVKCNRANGANVLLPCDLARPDLVFVPPADSTRYLPKL